eukprot:COSAG02_NODE_495_length_21151_cov_31.954256_14_plen_279_part_00
MGKQNKKKKKQRQKKQEEEEEELFGAALEAQVARLRRMQLSAEACGTEDQEHPNDDLKRAAVCGFRVCDVQTEAKSEALASQATESVSNEAAELREYFDAPSSPGPSDEGSGSNTAATVSERCSDEYFLAMHAPLERAERKRQGAAALHRDNGSKRRGQPAIRPDSARPAGSSSGFDVLEVDSSDSSDTSGTGDAQHGVEVLDSPPSDSAGEDDDDLEIIMTRDGQQIEVTGELIDAIIAIRTQASYLAPKKVAAKLKQQGFDTADLRRVVDAIWDDM